MQQRREHRQGRFVWLLDDTDRTAWIKTGHIGRCRTYHVPDHVVIEGVKYTVTSIKICAFNSSRTLKRLVIPDTINYVDEDVFCRLPNLPSTLSDFGSENFRGCKGLNTIILRANQVLVWDDSDIDGIPRTCHLQVPAGLIPDYRKHPAWGKFENIEPIV